MAPPVYLSGHPAEGAHCITVEINTEDPQQVALSHTLIRSFGGTFSVIEDLDPPRRRVYLLPGGALDLLDRQPLAFGKQEASL